MQVAGRVGGVAQIFGPLGVTFQDLANLLLLDYQLNGRRSIADAKQSLGHLRAFFTEEIDVREITYNRIVEYVARRLELGRARATVRKELAALKRAFRLGRHSDPTIIPPVFPTIKVQNARKGFVDGPQFDRLKAAASPHLRALIVFLFITGWRKSEATNLKWPQVDFEAGVVRIEPGESKNGDGRSFPFRDVPELDEMLRNQREWTLEIEWQLSISIPWVFHRPDGRPFKDFREAWERTCLRAGLPGLWVHDFRRSAIRNFERARVRRQTAMKLSGHRTEEVYRRYAITDFGDLEDAAKAIARLRRQDAARQQEFFFRQSKNLDSKDASAVQANARTQRSATPLARRTRKEESGTFGPRRVR